MKNWRPFLFPYHGPGSVPQGLSSFHPAPPRLLCAAARPQPCALGGLCRGAAQGLPPPCWVLPGTLSGAGQGTRGIFVCEIGKFPGCYVTVFQNTPALYPLWGYSQGEREWQNAKLPKTRKAKPAGGLRCLLRPKSCDHSRGVCRARPGHRRRPAGGGKGGAAGGRKVQKDDHGQG